MRLRNVKNAQEILEASRYFIKDPFTKKGLWPKDRPIHLEIGAGKGQFLINMAKLHPDIYFVGIEKYASVLVRAIQKCEEENLDNICFICVDATKINEVFDHEITTLYLNFSDPWPKKRHARRRLTSPDFLDRYENIFKAMKHIILKTDNISLFAYSLEQLSQKGYTFIKVSLDLAHEEIANVVTEYEEKFTKLGYKINYVDAQKI